MTLRKSRDKGKAPRYLRETSLFYEYRIELFLAGLVLLVALISIGLSCVR